MEVVYQVTAEEVGDWYSGQHHLSDGRGGLGDRKIHGAHGWAASLAKLTNARFERPWQKRVRRRHSV